MPWGGSPLGGMAYRRPRYQYPLGMFIAPVELLSINDALNASRLLAEALARADEKLVQSLREKMIKVKST